MAIPAQGQVLEEIIVSATKRAESIDDVPLAITAFSGDFTRSVNLDDVKDLVSFTPGVTGNSKDSFIDVISIRGIRTNDFGVGGDPSAGFFKNNLYEGRNGAVVTSLFDMERAEVLRGPQGFLFGRNAIGGAFSVHTRKAQIDARDGYVEVDAGERGHLVGEGAVNIPVNDQFAMRLAGYYSTEDGYVDNTVTPGDDELINHDKFAVRLSSRFTQDRMTIDAFLEYEEREQNGTMYRATRLDDKWTLFEDLYGTSLNGDDGRDIASEFLLGDPRDDADILTIGAQIDYELEWATITANIGYKDHDYFYTEDFDGTSIGFNNYGQTQTGDYLQGELRLVSKGDDPLSWYAGVSFYDEEIDASFTQVSSEDAMCQYYGYYAYGVNYNCVDLYDYYGSPFTPSPDGTLRENNRARGQLNGWAAYLDLNYAFSDALDIGVGLRYTYDEKEFDLSAPTPVSELGAYWALGFTTIGFLNDTRDWDELTPRVIMRYRPTDDVLLFASATRGYKSGGYGSFAFAPELAFGAGTDLTDADGFTADPFDPETVWSYEIGYKGTLLDGKAKVDLSAFFYDYKDLQITVDGQGGGIVVDNVGQVDAQGLEGSITASLNDNFDLYFSASYFDSEGSGLQRVCGLDDPNGCEGNPVWWAPEWSSAAVLNGVFPAERGGEWFGSLEMFYESERGGGWEQLNESKMGSYADWTLRAGYRTTESWTFTGYVENLTDELYYDGSSNGGGILPAKYFGPSRPRTAGIRVLYEFE
ncbi:MAG: TonB-dependent receptor [Woeseia sp.]|nr:TonB-dependent receptor [Woeseia sp.]